MTVLRRIHVSNAKLSLKSSCFVEFENHEYNYEGGDGKIREIFPRIPDEPRKPRNFSPSKLLSFKVCNNKA